MSLATNANNTLTYDGGAQGWPSFYSYFPDWMIGMNNYFYTFSNGNLYRHKVMQLGELHYKLTYKTQGLLRQVGLMKKKHRSMLL